MNEKSKEDIKNEIKIIISQISRIDTSEMEDHVLIREELGIDSLMAMEIIAICEKHLGITIDEIIFSGIERVGDFFDVLLALYRNKNAHRYVE